MIQQLYKFILLFLLLACSKASTAQIIPIEAYQSDTLSTSSSINGLPSMANDGAKTWMVAWSNGEHIQVATSTNGGKNWSPPRNEFEVESYSKPSITTDHNGTWLMTWKAGTTLFYAVSTDNGGSWGERQSIAESIESTRLNAPVIAIDGQKNIKVLWIAHSNNQITIQESSFQNNTWSSPSTLATYQKGGIIDNLSDLSVAANQEGQWVAAWLVHQIDADNDTYNSTIQGVAHTNGTWEELPTIYEPNIPLQNAKIANNGQEKWMIAWEEENPATSATLPNQIYVATSTNVGKTWSDASPVRHGKYPCVQFIEGDSWGLITASRNFIPGTGTDIDIIVCTSMDNGTTWKDSYLVNSYGNEDTGGFADGQWVNDVYPIFQQNNTGGWVVTWIANSVQNSNSRSEILYQLADSSPPFNVSVESEQAAVTSENTLLSFNWKSFIEEESGAVTYEYAFGDTSDIDRFQEFTPIDINRSRLEYLPSNFPDVFTTFFPTNKYVFTIRATNPVGLVRDGADTVCVSPLKIGQPIPLPPGKEWTDIDWENTYNNITPQNHVVFIEEEELLVANDYDLDKASFSIEWFFKDNSERQLFEYAIGPEPYKEAMKIYYTHEKDSQTENGAPKIDVTNIDRVNIHYNSTVPVPTDSLPAFWESVNQNTRQKLLNARAQIKQLPAFVILTYQDVEIGTGNTKYLEGYEIVEIKPDEQDVKTGIVDIGSRLLPFVNDKDTTTIIPLMKETVFRGSGRNEGFVYQHIVPNSNQFGHLWAIGKNEIDNKSQVFWQREGLAGVVWPYQLRQYSSPNWPTNPTKYQLYIRSFESDTIGQSITIPQKLNPELTLTEFGDENAFNTSTNTFSTSKPGWSLLKYQTGTTPGLDWIGFEVVKSVNHDDTSLYDLQDTTWNIGQEIIDEYHEGPRKGYVHVPEGDRFAPAIYGETGQIFPVNTGKLEVWWSNLSRITDPEGVDFPNWPAEYRIQWPSKVARYEADWGEIAQEDWLIIASQKGSGQIKSDSFGTFIEDWNIYYQNDSITYGFNPNDEHALVESETIFALRDDLGSANTSEPYVLMWHKDFSNSDNYNYQFRVFKVVRETPEFPFKYNLLAGQLIQAPTPVIGLHKKITCNSNFIEPISGPYFKDRKCVSYAKAAGNDGGTAETVTRFYYPFKESFYKETLPENQKNAATIPWLDEGTGIPINITHVISWPEIDDRLKWGETRIGGLGDIPNITSACSVDIIYQQSLQNDKKESLVVLEPTIARAVNLDFLPDDIEQKGVGDKITFPQLPPAIKNRLSYIKSETRLKFAGAEIMDGDETDHYLLNVMSEAERKKIAAISEDPLWKNKIDTLYLLAKEPTIITNSHVDDYDKLALSTGLAEGAGYVTIIVGNGNPDSTKCRDAAAISVHILEVVDTFSILELEVYEAECPLDERVTVRHKGDFGGKTDSVKFEWYSLSGSKDPSVVPIEQWVKFPTTPSNGLSSIDITIEGPGLETISDNWYKCKYIMPDSTEVWSKHKNVEGWIKRVLKRIDGFQQSYKDFDREEVTVISSMISVAGDRWNGDVPLSCDGLDNFGLIEIYETILNRGIQFSIGSGYNDDDANKALLQVATKLVELYTLLGNEAFADAADPTIGFGTSSEVGNRASSLYNFKGLMANLIEEELALLRGRDDSNNEVDKTPYNRLPWNTFGGDGTVAYVNNYNIRDANGDGALKAEAQQQYPQGHGDAWGHYLQAVKNHYRLLRDSSYSWKTSTDVVSDTRVDFFDEEKFAVAAAAKARTGAEIVSLTYRNNFVEDPEGQWQGYKDPNTERAWGFDEWADRTGQGAYFDWIVGNAILPVEDTEHEGIEKIDRNTVLELREIAGQSLAIQTKLDEANAGLNPLGVATNVIPMGISPNEFDAGKTHFEQIYDRAVIAMNNVIAAFNQANTVTQEIRRQANKLEDFSQMVGDRELDYNNRLIEIYGTPYPDDIGPRGTYETGYNGPDIYNYNMVDPSELMLTDFENTKVVETKGYFREIQIDENGNAIEVPKEVTFYLDNTGNRLGEVKNPAWTIPRKAPGEIQMARSELLLAKGRLDKALIEYDNLLASIDEQVELIELQAQVNAEEINILYDGLERQRRLNQLVLTSRQLQLAFRTAARIANQAASASAEYIPTAVGPLSADVGAPARGAIKTAGVVLSEMSYLAENVGALIELDHQQQFQLSQAQNQIDLKILGDALPTEQQINQLKQLVRQESSLRLELYSLQENIQQAISRYQSVLARGQRLVEERTRFRKKTAANVQTERYNDMAFRIFRNDALQKYRAQFDLAARYVYLAAKAYDYETASLSSDSRAGQNFLTDIVRKRLIGNIGSGLPLPGEGLADAIAVMSKNFENFKVNSGINNNDFLEREFSLRKELFRISNNLQGNTEWRQTLNSYIVPNVLELPEFQRYCIPFGSQNESEPAIVIPFETTIKLGQNFFGLTAEGGDNVYNTTDYSTKIRTVGIHFSNYNSSEQGLLRTPTAYLIPVGYDYLLSPTDPERLTSRQFKVLDQVLPSPFNITKEQIEESNSWLPSTDSQDGNFVEIRRFGSFEVNHDGNSDKKVFDSELIGRSVWNSRWLLIIPAASLLSSDTEAALDIFINGVRGEGGISDIKLELKTYSSSGW